MVARHAVLAPFFLHQLLHRQKKRRGAENLTYLQIDELFELFDCFGHLPALASGDGHVFGPPKTKQEVNLPPP